MRWILKAVLLAGWAGSLWCQVPVHHKEGLVHGFLTLRSMDGKLLADGDLIQNAKGDRVSSRLIFHFKDGSLHEEEAVFSQRGTFRLLSDHLVQKGPAFEHPLEMKLDVAKGECTVHSLESGKEKSFTEHPKIPENLANGFLLVLLKNLEAEGGERKLSMLIPTPKLQPVTLIVRSSGREKFKTGDTTREAEHVSVHFEIGGLTGVLATLFGKQPPDLQVWILTGEAPAFLKSEGSLAPGGPVWRIELASPTWPKNE